MKNKKLVRKISFNIAAISTTLLGGYIICDNPCNTKEFALLLTSTISSLGTLGYSIIDNKEKQPYNKTKKRDKYEKND